MLLISQPHTEACACSELGKYVITIYKKGKKNCTQYKTKIRPFIKITLFLYDMNLRVVNGVSVIVSCCL